LQPTLIFQPYIFPYFRQRLAMLRMVPIATHHTGS
jgi:hypothetical protein